MISAISTIRPIGAPDATAKIGGAAPVGGSDFSKVLADTLQFDAFAAPGSSGSAVFDSRGSPRTNSRRRER